MLIIVIKFFLIVTFQFSLLLFEGQLMKFYNLRNFNIFYKNKKIVITIKNLVLNFQVFIDISKKKKKKLRIIENFKCLENIKK